MKISSLKVSHLRSEEHLQFMKLSVFISSIFFVTLSRSIFIEF
jgi:hypothetical protein